MPSLVCATFDSFCKFMCAACCVLLQCSTTVFLCVDNQFFLACIARRMAVISKSQVSQSIAQFDTKQDLHGKILVVDTGYNAS